MIRLPVSADQPRSYPTDESRMALRQTLVAIGAQLPGENHLTKDQCIFRRLSPYNWEIPDDNTGAAL